MTRTRVLIAARCLGAALLTFAPSGAAEPENRPPSAERPQSAPDETPEADSSLGQAAARVERAAEGQAFPALKLKVLPPGGSSLVPLDLAVDLGKRPVVLVYFLMEYRISEDVLGEIRDFVASEAKGKVALYPVVRMRADQPITELVERARLLKIEEPIIVDNDGTVQKTIGAGVVPDITLIDQKGVFCFTRACSLKQPILKDVDVRESIRIAARGEEPPVVFGLLPYANAGDFIGGKFMDFTLPDYASGVSLRLADHVGPGHVTALFYWSPRCPFSKRVMPMVTASWRTYHPKYLDIVSVVRMKSGENKDEVTKYAAENNVAFPVLLDRNHRFTDLYRVTATPTLIIIGPDGKVDSVYTSGNVNVFAILQAKINNLVVKAGADAAAGSR